MNLSGMTFLNLPWIIMGDFNAVVSQDEHRGGSHYYYSIKAFVFRFISTNNLLDVNYVGSLYTWCNIQHGLARWWARLDYCLVNLMRSNSFDTCLIKHLLRFLSDHSPLLLSIYPHDVCEKKTFRFENY